MPVSTFICDYCGKTFQRYASQTSGKRHYCSPECHYADPLTHEETAAKLRKRIAIKCANCGQILMRHPARIRRGTKHHFCDIACHGEWLHKNNTGKNNPNWIERIIVPCDNCGKELDLVPWETTNAEYHFCCQECRGLWLSKNYSGENASNWQGGLSFEPYSPDFNKQLKEQVRKRDNHICQLCGMSQDEHHNKFGKNLPVHHINYDKKDSRIVNLITLCIPCHSQTNYNREYYEQILSEYIGRIDMPE